MKYPVYPVILSNWFKFFLACHQSPTSVKDLKERLARKYPLLDFRVFGSKVRGDDTSQSDIDVMIKIPELNPVVESEIYDFVFDVNLNNDCFISVIKGGRGQAS